MLASMNRTKAGVLDEAGALPMAPLTKAFVVTAVNKKQWSISRQQPPITPAYAFTDYRAQAQTIEYCVFDIGRPPSGQLTPFNAYVARSCSRGRALHGSTNNRLRGIPKRTFGSLQRLDRASSINKAGPVNGSLLSTYVASAKCQLTTLNSVFLSSAKFDGSLPLKCGTNVAKKRRGQSRFGNGMVRE